MDEQHTHTEKTYTLNNELVCENCHPKTDDGTPIGGNECFCSCHQDKQLRCPKCVRFHIPATEL